MEGGLSPIQRSYEAGRCVFEVFELIQGAGEHPALFLVWRSRCHVAYIIALEPEGSQELNKI